MRVLLDFFRLIRLPNLLIIALTQYAIRFGLMVPFLAEDGHSLQLPESDFFLLVLATVMIAAAGYIINDYFDTKLDFINKPKRIIVGRSIKRRWAMGMHLVINGLALFIAFKVAWSIGHPMLILFQLLSAVILWFYSVSFKKQFLIGNLTIAALSALVPFTAGYYEFAVLNDHIPQAIADMAHHTPAYALQLNLYQGGLERLFVWIVGYTIFAYSITLIREIVKDIEDIEGDKAYDCKTLPVVLGERKAALGAMFACLPVIGALFFIQWMQWKINDLTSILYFSVLLLIPMVVVFAKLAQAKEKRHYSSISLWLKLIMFFGIAYTAIIYFQETHYPIQVV